MKMMGGGTSQKLLEVEAEILKIFEECKSEGLSKEEIAEIFAPLGLSKNKVKKILPPGRPLPSGFCRRMGASLKRNIIERQATLKKILGVVAIFAIGALVIGQNEEQMKTLRFHALAVIRIALIKMLPYWNWTDLYYSRCLVRNPFFEIPNLQVDDCNLCESLEEILRVANVSQGQIIDDFIRREKPFIVTDAMDDWHIMKTDQFWFDNVTEIYLKQENYKICSVNTNLRIPGGDFTRLLKKLYNPRTQEWFIHWENCQKEMAKWIRQFYKRPYFISNSLDFTGSNWILMSSDFKGRVYKKIEATDSLLMLYQLRGFNNIRITPKETCRGYCPELTTTLNEGHILVMTNLLWILEYIPGEEGDNLAILSEVSWPSME